MANLNAEDFCKWLAKFPPHSTETMRAAVERYRAAIISGKIVADNPSMGRGLIFVEPTRYRYTGDAIK